MPLRGRDGPFAKLALGAARAVVVIVIRRRKIITIRQGPQNDRATRAPVITGAGGTGVTATQFSG